MIRDHQSARFVRSAGACSCRGAATRGGGQVKTCLPCRNGWAGFTLVEVVITAGLLVIVLGLLFIPIWNSLNYFRTASARADAQTVARTALDAVAREISEAMAVQLDMYDSSMIAFVPPLRVDPDDPNSEVVSPPRPDWGRVIRFWRALNEPTRNYNPGTRLEPGNMFFLARTVVPEPFKVDDYWNRWNLYWAHQQSSLVAEGVNNWAPIPRAVHSDVDYRARTGQIGARNRTLQPGYPYLEIMDQLYQARGSYAAALPLEAVRRYRSAVVGLTPNAPEYDVSQLSFSPTVVAGERLQPAEGADGPNLTLYRARYPLWRLGYPYTGWTVLADRPDVVQALENLGLATWARDPFLLIRRWTPASLTDPLAGGEYKLAGIGAFDPRTRTMKVVDLGNSTIYDTGADPSQRPDPTLQGNPRFGFSIDWVDASLRFDSPQRLLLEQGAQDIALHTYWSGYDPGQPLGMFLVPDSVSAVVLDSSGKPSRTLKRVYCQPRERSDEFQLGVQPKPEAGQPRYGWIRLPAVLADGQAVTTHRLQMDFRWRNNGVVPPSVGNQIMTMDDERPDLITAYYRTDAVIDIGITVTRADPSAPIEKRIAQSAHLSRRVKLHNVLREIRYGEE